MSYDDDTKRIVRLHDRIKDLEHSIERLRTALEFYADPENYHAIMFLVDRPAGGFADDFDTEHGHEFYDRPMPGKRARRALEGK